MHSPSNDVDDVQKHGEGKEVSGPSSVSPAIIYESHYLDAHRSQRLPITARIFDRCAGKFWIIPDGANDLFFRHRVAKSESLAKRTLTFVETISYPFDATLRSLDAKQDFLRTRSIAREINKFSGILL